MLFFSPKKVSWPIDIGCADEGQTNDKYDKEQI